LGKKESLQQTEVNIYHRIFGVGPTGLLLSALLLLVAYFLEDGFAHLEINSNDLWRWSVFTGLCVVSGSIMLWSILSLPITDRGKRLTTTGAFRYFRHPLYGAFLSFFNFGLAVLLNNWIYILWAVIQHPVWHWLIRYEEKLMEKRFPGEYEKYASRTGRFFPRLSLKKQLDQKTR
jgi:protein-S-isoprenylcysteine O-methyltransferase Ste14